MITLAYKMCLKRIAIATMLLTIAQWSYGGFVLCYGSDGHVAMEPVFHNHCPEPDHTGNQNNSSESEADLSFEHSYCKDTITASDFYVLAQKNHVISLLKIVTTNSFLKAVSPDVSSHLRYSDMNNDQLSPFFTPLRTVILLV